MQSLYLVCLAYLKVSIKNYPFEAVNGEWGRRGREDWKGKRRNCGHIEETPQGFYFLCDKSKALVKIIPLSVNC